MAEQLLAGVAREIISPPKGIYLIGYGAGGRNNVGVHDDLTATALVLAHGRLHVAWVACDLLCINEAIVDRVRAALGSTVEVIIACSHTHSGPIVYADDHSRRARRDYVDFLVARIVSAVKRAEATLVPVTLAWGRAEADIAVNRRERKPDGSIIIGVNPDGVVDSTVSVLRVLTLQGDSLATIVNYACHGTVLGPQNRWVSADWIGAMRARVEIELGGMALFLQGATANLNPVHNTLSLSEDPWSAVQTLGERVARQVLSACGECEPCADAPLRFARQEIELPLEAEVTTVTPPKHHYRRQLAVSVGLPRWLSFVVDPLLAQRYPWHSCIVARNAVWHVPLRINTVRIGEIGVVTFGAEVFTEIGMMVKSVAPTAKTLFASVSDGCIGYLPTDDAHTAGGYEVDVVPFFYRYPGRLAQGNAQRTIDAAEQMLRACFA
ncbi:MAG: neutral/alkaline non-lysosomal ceramidase N-terminal domain-containing protein [Anaerolineae bacterium]|nr:neutral/alkaline non-lysosomal ceramidase N-terminal domain-containing protein [Anaerolineae bacterium]